LYCTGFVLLNDYSIFTGHCRHSPTPTMNAIINEIYM
jgi:hypothetical protein